MTYAEKLLDPRWQKRRLEILSRDNFTCQWCGDSKSTLHVHHTHYMKQEEPWETDEVLLVCICADCHDLYHRLNKLEAFLWECLRNSYKQDGLMELIPMSKRVIKNILKNG